MVVLWVYAVMIVTRLTAELTMAVPEDTNRDETRAPTTEEVHSTPAPNTDQCAIYEGELAVKRLWLVSYGHKYHRLESPTFASWDPFVGPESECVVGYAVNACKREGLCESDTLGKQPYFNWLISQRFVDNYYNATVTPLLPNGKLGRKNSVSYEKGVPHCQKIKIYLVKNVAVSKNSTSLTVTWEKPDGPKHCSRGYLVSVREWGKEEYLSKDIYLDREKTSYSEIGLTPETEYVISVKTLSNVRQSRYEPIHVMTDD